MGAGSMLAFDARTPANLGCSKWLDRHDSNLERWRVPRAETFPARARFKFDDGRLRGVRLAATIPLGIPGGRGLSAAFVLEADIRAVLRKGALEAVGG